MSIIETQENIHSKGIGSILSRFWTRISNPHPEVTEIGDRRRAQLLAGLSLILVLPLTFGIILRFFTNDPSEWFAIETFEFFGLVLFALLAYILSRTQYFNWGSISLVTAFSITAIINSFANNTVDGAIFFLIPAFVIGSALLRLGGIAALVFINVAILFLLPMVFPSIEQSFSDTGIVLTSGLLLVLVVAVRNLIERERLAEVENVNEELRSLQSSLEQRVANATRNLELAAEVGQRLSLVRETNIMLTEAVQIIGERFDFYYTQVYLTDPTGRALVLQAGTGEVGQTLARRGHRLPVDMSSLNGIAATERRPVIVEDTETSPLHRFNPLLPDTRSEMVVPLLVGERVVGVLDMQSSRPGALSGENLPAFEALAGQLAISIANAELFEEAERARSTVEAQARRLASEGWHDFMDAIERSERFAYTYDLENVTPFEAPLLSAIDETTLAIPIQVSGEPVGTFQLERETGWTEDDQAVVITVADQVAQQIENLRLLAQAEQYQAEAQEALQRLTREGWEQYQEQFEDKQVGFVYSDFEVKALDQVITEYETAVTIPISLRNETIGQIEVLDTETLSDEDAELVAYVNEQLSAHLENIRLSAQTEQALANTEEQAGRLALLNELSEQLTGTENLDQILTTTSRYLNRIIAADRVSITWPSEDGKFLEVFALQGEAGAIPTGTKLPVEGSAIGAAYAERRVVRVDDLAKNNYLENAKLMEQGLNSTMAVPLLTTDKTLGTLNFGSQTLNAFDSQQRDLAIQAASLVSGIIENQELFSQTQDALAQTEVLYEIGRQLNLANNEDDILMAVSKIAIDAGCVQSTLMYVDLSDEDGPQWMWVAANWLRDEEVDFPVGFRFDLVDSPAVSLLMNNPDQPLLIENVATEKRLDEATRDLWIERNTQAIVNIPLSQSGRWLGLLTFNWAEPHQFSEQEKEIFNALVSLATPAVQSRRLFTQAQTQAQREQALRQITEAVRGFTDPATIMRTAVQELGNALGRRTQIRFGQTEQTPDQENGNS